MRFPYFHRATRDCTNVTAVTGLPRSLAFSSLDHKSPSGCLPISPETPLSITISTALCYPQRIFSSRAESCPANSTTMPNSMTTPPKSCPGRMLQTWDAFPPGSIGRCVSRSSCLEANGESRRDINQDRMAEDIAGRRSYRTLLVVEDRPG